MKRYYLILFFGVLCGCEAIFIEDISDENVQVLAPQNATTVNSGTITFNWESVDEAESYLIQIATPTFQSASQIVLDSVATDLSFERFLDVGEYEWRIKAMNSEYETDYTVVGFTVN